MPTPEYCTLDGDPGTSVQPYVPTVDDMGGAAFVDDDVDPPEPEENVMARDINQMQELLVRACKMMPKASFHVRFTSAGAGTATLLGFKSSNALFLSSQVTLTPDTNGFIIQWPLDLLPDASVGALLTPSYVYVADSSPASLNAVIRVSQSVDASNAYVTVRVIEATGTMATCNITCRVDVDGQGTFYS